MSDGKVVDIILHCQKQIKKDLLPDDKLLHYLGRLSRLRVTVHDLAETGIGRTVNSLSRNEGPVGQAADTLVRGWKRMVSEQQSQVEKETEDDESDSNSGSSEEEEDEVGVNSRANKDTGPYEIDEPGENQPATSRRCSNGHSTNYDESTGYNDEDDEDMNDDIDDPYIDGGFLMDNVHSGDDDTEEEAGPDRDSEGSEHLEIDADDVNEELSPHHSATKSSTAIVKHEKLSSDEMYPKNLHLSKYDNNNSSSSQHHKSHEYEHHKRHSSCSNSSLTSKSHYTSLERSSEKNKSSREQKHQYHSSSKDSASKDHYRSKQNNSSSNGDPIYEPHNSSSSQHRSYHHHSFDKSKESRPDQQHHHKDKDRHRSKESSGSSNSSHRDKEKELPSSKSSENNLRSFKDKDKKESANDHHHHRNSNSRNSNNNAKNKVRDAAQIILSSTTHSSSKKSSLENIKKESFSPLADDRKRKDLSDSSDFQSGSSAGKKSKMILKDEIDSNSGINFADVLGSLDVSSANSLIKQSGSSKKEKDRRKEDHEKGRHRKSHHDHGLSSSSGSSSSKRHSSSSSKHSLSSSSRDAGSSSSTSASSSKNKYDSSLSSRKAFLPQSKIESVIQPVVNISPNYKPSSSLAKLVRPGHSSGGNSNCNNGFTAPPPISLSQVELSDLGSVEYLDKTAVFGGGDMSQEDAISTMLSNRNQRSKVFSGTKAGRRSEVSSLFDLCMQVIKDNIGDLGYTGGIPYDILKPALERANPLQLINIESQNDYLIGETDELWQFHCRRDFRGKVPGETESWRELYERGTEERQLKFEVVKKKMKKTIEKAEPVRKAKLAYVDTSSTTRFKPQKAQTIKNGMKTLKIMEEKGPSRGVASSASAGFNNPKKSGTSSKVVVEEAAIIIAPESRAGHAPAPSVSREPSAAKLKPKKAPLMQKTMKLIKSLHRR